MADKEKKVEEAMTVETSEVAEQAPAEATNEPEGETVDTNKASEQAPVEATSEPKAEKKAGKPEKAEKAEKPQKASKPDDYTPRLKSEYVDRIVPAMIERFGYKNRLEVPRLDKIVLNMGVGEATQDKKKVETAAAEMERIAGQKPVITKAKKSIAQFKLREGMPNAFNSARACSSLRAVVTIEMFIPRSLSTLLKSISGKISCSRIPMV